MDTLTSNIERLSKLQDITVKSDDKTLENYLNGIRSSIRNTNFLTASFNLSYGSTTKVPTAIPEIITEYFTSTSTLLNKIAKKTSQIANIAVEIEKLDTDMSKQTEELNEQVLTGTAVQTGAALLTNTVTNDIDNSKQTVNETYTINNENINQTVSQQEVTTTNNNQQVLETVRKTSTPVYQKNNSIEEQFIEYEKLYSTNDKVVYNYNDKYKIVIHHENGRITGVEHYYNYQNSEEAIKAIGQLNVDYKNVENFNKIIQKDNLVKVVFKEDMFKNISLDKFKENYKALEEVLEQL